MKTHAAPHQPPSDLEARAKARRVLLAVMAVPCPKHDAKVGQPCWTVPTDSSTTRLEHQGMCGARVTASHQPPAAKRPRTTKRRPR